MQADWPELYKASELAKSNAARAAQLVEESKGRFDKLTVEGGIYASTFGVQVSKGGKIDRKGTPVVTWEASTPPGWPTGARPLTANPNHLPLQLLTARSSRS